MVPESSPRRPRGASRAAPPDDARPDSRAERWERRLSKPVLVAALASVPAVFLSLLGGAFGTAGRVVDVLSGAVLVGETVVLFVVSGDRRRWLRDHAWLVGLTVVVIIAVAFAAGPLQLLRLVRSVGALRVVRASRIIRAARVMGARMGAGRAGMALASAAGLLAAVFVGVVLADPTSRSRSLLATVVGDVGTPGVVTSSVAAGLVLGVATWFLVRHPQDPDDDDVDDDPDDDPEGPGDPGTRRA